MRQKLNTLLLSVAALSAGECLIALPLHESIPSRPNVLLITIDDLNDVPRFMGRNRDAYTPNLDRLAAQGTSFLNAHANFPLCGPSRASLMTGFMPSSIGFDGHMTNEQLKERSDRIGVKLLDAYFKRHNYRVFSAGKIYHAGNPPSEVDLAGGNAAFGAKEGLQYFHERTSTDWGVPSYGASDENFSDYDNAQFAIQRLSEDHSEPFLLMVGFVQPHVPWYAPQRYFDLYPEPQALQLAPYEPDDMEDVPAIAIETSIGPQYPRTEWAIAHDQRASIQHAYLASVSFTDHYLGLVLKALAESPYAEETLVVVVSDHGYHLGEKNTYQKESLWERSSHIPFIVSGPGVPSQSIEGKVVSLIDLYPTLLDYCHLPAIEAHEGRSLLPLIANDDPNFGWQNKAVTSFRGNNHAIQTEHYRYSRWSDGSEELYDHRSDLAEIHNLAADPTYRPLMDTLRRGLPTNLRHPQRPLRFTVDGDQAEMFAHRLIHSGELQLYGVDVTAHGQVVEGMVVESVAMHDWIEFRMSSQDGFGKWRQAHFSADEMSELSLSGAGVDTDRDGFSLLAEYAFGLDPRRPDQSQIFTMDFSAEDQTITFTFPMHAKCGDVLYVVMRQDNISEGSGWEEFVSYDVENGLIVHVEEDCSWKIQQGDRLEITFHGDQPVPEHDWIRVEVEPLFARGVCGP